MGEVRGRDFDEALALARAIELEDGPAIDNAAVRERLADWYVRSQGLRYTPLSHHDGALACGHAGPGGLHRQDRERGQAPGHRLVRARFVMDMGGAILDPELAPMRAAFQKALLYPPGGRIGGGTDEILKHIIAERVLGLPADIRVDKDTAFKNVPTGRETDRRSS